MAYTRNGAATDAATDYGFSAGVAHVAPEPIADAAFTDDDYVADAAFLDEGDEDASAWGDEGGSARYALSGELVRQTYAPLDAHFSQTPIPVTAHVLPNAGEAAMQAADVYEDVLGAMATRYPQRVARLRDLYFRVKVARQTRIGLERRDEAIRVAYNERNNSNNERIAGELNDLRGEWTTRRRACETELATMRETLVKRETVLLAEAATAESDLWALRKQLAGEWDAQIATERAAQAGRDAEAARLQSLRDESEITVSERERVGEIACAQAAAQARRAEREQVWAKQQAHEQAATEAYEALHAARLAVATPFADALAPADATLCDAEQSATAEWDTVENGLRDRAFAVRAGYAERLEAATQAMSNARARVAARQGEQEGTVQVAEAARNAAAARAGVPTEAVETGGVRETLLAHLPNSRTEGGVEPDEYLEAGGVTSGMVTVWQKIGSGAEKVLELLCLVVFGGIFGTSLGLLFEAFRFSNLSQPDIMREKAVVVGVFLTIGTGIFYIMGRTIEHFVTLAVEASGRDKKAAPDTGFWARPSTYAASLAVIVVLLFIGVEATIERFGIVETFAEAKRFAAGGDPVKIKQAEGQIANNQWAYAAIALVASLPFALFHVGVAWRTAKHHVAVAARRVVIAGREEAFLERAEVRELLGAQATLATARANAATGCAESRSLAENAERHISELRGEQATHPDLQRMSETDAERDAFFATHPALRVAREQRERLNREIDAHPEVDTVKSRYEYHAAQAEVIRAWLAQNLWEAGASVASAFVERAGAIAGDALHDVAQRATAAAPQAVAQSLADGVVALATGSRETVTAPHSFAEQAAEHRFADQRERIKTDPAVRYCRNRIASLQERLRHMEAGYKRRITSLKKQRRAVELTPGARLGRELADAETQVLSAQLQFEQEYAKLVRLLELPAFFRWFSHLRQVWLRPDAVVVYAESANRARPLPVAIAAKGDD